MHENQWQIMKKKNENQWVVAGGGRSGHGRLPSPPASSVTGVRYDNKKTVPRFSSVVLGNCNRMRQDLFSLKTLFLVKIGPPVCLTSFKSWHFLLQASFCDWSGPQDDQFWLKTLFSVKKGPAVLGQAWAVLQQFQFSGLPQSLDFQ